MVYKLFLLFSMIFISTSLYTANEASSVLVENGWSAWQQNNKKLVEEKFNEALIANPKDKRAYLGLTLLYSLEHKEREAWENFNKFIQLEQNYYPYVYSLLMSNIIYGQELTNPEIVNLYKKLIEHPDKDGILSAMALERLGNYYLSKKDFKESEKYFEKLNTINDWFLIGPFDNVSASGYDKIFPPENEFFKNKIYEGKNGIPVQWYKPTILRRDLWVDFTRYFANNSAIYYGNTFVYSPIKQTVQIRIGTSGSLRAFLNDQMIIDIFDEYNNDLDTYVAEVELQSGWNRLLVKCGYSEIDNCNFLVRITNSNGNKVENLMFSSEENKYTSVKNSPVVLQGNFAETFFREEIKNNPKEPENYIFLAEAYLRNDKSIESELVLHDAIDLFPGCLLFQQKIIEAYLRGKKNDEMETAFEKIFNTDNTLPDVLDYKLSKYLQNEELDKAWGIIEIMEKNVADKKLLYNAYFDYYSKKKEFEKITEIDEKATKQYPYDQGFAYINALIAFQKSRNQKDAINILEDFLERNYTTNILYYIAQFYLESSDIEKWEKYMEKLVELNPASPGYYFQMAETYLSMHKYDEAEKNINKALSLCNSYYMYWSELGQIYKMQNRKEEAISAYNNALKFNPADYDSREVLRELNSQKSYFELFEQEDTKELIKKAPEQKEYPLDNGIILLNDMKRIVYKNGASENSEETLIKLFNKKGIDNFKEYWISFNSYSEQLIVEKAVVIKKDDSEIKADINNNHIVFKSLEENDCIYIKYKIKNKYYGKLSNHYWDSYNFNYFYPVKKVSYSILLEDNKDFHYVAQNMNEKPVIKNIKEGSIYRWSLENQPAVTQEYGMPQLSDIGKILYISNIPDWSYLVDWYIDLSKNKTRSSYEIKKLVSDLLKDKGNLTEEDKIKIIYSFVTENIRYSSVSFRQSGFIPQTARNVLINKIGDCKDKAVLCKALLNEAGINSYLVLINTTDNGLNNNILPSLCFNHCILCVETKKGEKFLDLTAENFSSSVLPLLDINAFYLLIKPGVTAPSRMSKEQFAPSNSFRNSQAEITQDGKIILTKTTIKTGILGAYIRSWYRYLEGDEIKKAIVENLNDKYPNVNLISYEFKNLDDIELPTEYTFKCELSDYVSETGDFLILKMPWEDKFNNDPGFAYDKRQFPYKFNETGDTLSEEIKIKIPDNYIPMDANYSTKYNSSYADYLVSVSVNKKMLIGKRTFINKTSGVSVEDYSGCREFYNKVMKEDNRQILLKKKK